MSYSIHLLGRLLLSTSFLFLAIFSLEYCGGASGGGDDNPTPSDFMITDISMSFSGTSVYGNIKGTTVTFQFPFSGTTIPTSGTLERLTFSADGVTPSKKAGNVITFTNKTTTLTATAGSQSKTFELKIVNTSNQINQFYFLKSINPSLSNDIYATIDGNKITFSSAIANDIDRTRLVPTFVLSSGATVKVSNVTQVSGQTANDYSTTQSYEVTAEDGTSKYTYTVSPIPTLIKVIDDQLRAYLKSTYRNYFVGDLLDPNAKGIESVTELNISNKNITTTAGIEAFASVTKLQCAYNQLSSLDISKLPKLKQLYASNNRLTSIELTANTELVELDLSSNRLSSLPTLTRLSKLEILNLSLNPNLSSITLSSSPLLKRLEIANCNLTSLGLNLNSALTYLNCSVNKIGNLNLASNSNLTELNCSFNNLIYLNISKMQVVVTLSIIGTGDTGNFKDGTIGELVIHTALNNNIEVTKIRNTKPDVKISYQ